MESDRLIRNVGAVQKRAAWSGASKKGLQHSLPNPTSNPNHLQSTDAHDVVEIKEPSMYISGIAPG